MKSHLLILFSLLGMVPGCTVFRNTAVDRHVAVSRDFTLQGLAANSSQEQARAEEYFTQAVHSDPDNVEARMLLAESYRKKGQADAAIEQLEAALKIAPENTELICQLGSCYSVTKQEKYAYRLAQLALRKNRKSVEAWTLKAQSLWKMGIKEQALADYQRALRIEPDNNELRRQMANLYLELGKPQRALTTLDKIASDYDELRIPEEILLPQATALGQIGRHSEAIDRLAIGYQRGGYSEELAESYLAALVSDQRLAKAVEISRSIGQQFPDSERLARIDADVNQRFAAYVAQNAQQSLR